MNPCPLRRLLAAAALLLATGTGMAHPAWGIQVGSRGEVYFSDLKHVYVAGPDKPARRFVPDVHTHALYLDADGQLVGDHSWVRPDGTFQQDWWRAGPDGVRTPLSTYQAAAWAGLTAPDSSRWMPVSDVGKGYAVLERIDADGSTRRIAGGELAAVDGPFDRARFGVFGAAVPAGPGRLLVTSGNQLRAVSVNQQVSTVLGAAQGQTFASKRFSGLLGFDQCEDGSIWIADHAGRRVLRWAPQGRQLETKLRADWTWTPAGIACHAATVYVLEHARPAWRGAARVRRLDDRSGAATVIATN